ncbi:alpha/beta hydrolase [Mesorhizobium sp. C416B]|uniref:alpha/beta hydrolase n=1 Tax=unclassified Mesorhizobium TaxID=325217 RepID=UPI0003CF310B|nr:MULTISPECIES: alpha/beta hydrolase [unclassified Mesorhizobium]ESX49425.1 hypothetical protein X762_12225 [Mesorhizobium sp. LSHC426A00]ESX55661.1 hypothetical protein X761_12755 [Mesorhizobium sp. LSHC424B00]ESX70546.1 hypothetical protein X758_18145 [Mesorhizobium sp. LSHC416B00]WJI61909.1 alpha/beta hydrolase [Mesorhizobium sp. C416B]
MMWRFVFLCWIVLSSVGCAAGLPKVADLSCVPESDTAQVDLFFVTDRGIAAGAPEVLPDSSRSDRLTYGMVRLDLPTTRKRSFGTITSDFKIASLITYKDSADFLQEVKARARNRSVLLYTHGFNEDFQESAFRVGYFYLDGCLKTIPILFSWPSKGSMFAHSYDLDSASFARGAYFNLLRSILDSHLSRPVDLMAHSMGNWIVLEALNRLKMEGEVRGKPAGRVGTVILASPDVDVDVFRTLLPGALGVSDRVVLMTSRKDKLLLVSRLFALGGARAGQATGAELMNHGIVASRNFSVFRMDSAEVGNCPALGHRCATANPYVVNYEKRILEQRQPQK